ncbi:MAG: response regulator [Lachnospiraceae bacterium]|nr:response regulator [Lachnospiraceae bacterium]
MRELLFCLIYGFAVITYFIGFTVLHNGSRKNRIDRLYFLSAIFSAGWSLFIGLVLIQTNTDMAALMRAIGVFHIFGQLICITDLLVYWSDVRSRVKRWSVSFVRIGVILYPFMIQSKNVIFEKTAYGMSFRMKPGIWSAAYTVFCMVVALNLLLLIIHMLRRSIRKREKIIAYALMLCVFIVGFGCALDTMMQMAGVAAVPISAIGQFAAQMVLYRIYQFYNKSRVTLENMSEFVYYSVDEPVFLFDEAEKLCIVNNGATAFLGMSAQECCKLRLSDIFALDRDAFRFQGNKNRVEARCWQNNNICSVSIDKIYDDYRDIIGYIVIVHDVTERVRMLESLEQEKLRADKANEAKGVFLANMSHEIRTPINAVMGMNEMILRECEDETILEYAGNIQDASRTLLVLINDILDFSKIESGMLEVIEEAYSLRALLKTLKTECNMRAENKGLDLIFDVPQDTPNILLGDEVRVRQILLNILTNAIKYTMKGSVTMKVSYHKVKEREVEITFAVTDTGIGIKKENIDRLFGKFDRIDEEQVHAIEGTGLGLSIVDKLVHLMHGTVTVDSVFGEGSTFTVCLRQQVIGEETVGILSEEKKRKERRKDIPVFVAPEAKILAVDDNKVNLTVIKALLRKTKVQVTCVETGKECLEHAAKEYYDVILLDHMMPGMDGIETLEALKQMSDNKCKDAAVIALTANAMAGVREMYLEKGFDDYLAKPIEGTVLEQLLMRYLPTEYIIKNEGAG